MITRVLLKILARRISFEFEHQFSESVDACSSIGIAINASLAYGLPSVILSLDLDNAYNSIDRSFVAEALINSEIDPNIVIILMNHYNSANICFHNTSFNLGCKRGILQGDPTSSKIFAIAMEVNAENSSILTIKMTLILFLRAQQMLKPVWTILPLCWKNVG